MQRVAARWTLVSGTFLCEAGVRCVADYRLWMPVQFLPYCGKSASGRSCSCCVPSRLARRLYASPANTSISSSCRGGMAATTLALRCKGRARHSVSPCFCCEGCEQGARVGIAQAVGRSLVLCQQLGKGHRTVPKVAQWHSAVAATCDALYSCIQQLGKVM